MKHALMSVGAFAVAMMTVTMLRIKNAPPPAVPVNPLAVADSLLADSLWLDSVIVARREPEDHQAAPVRAVDDHVPGVEAATHVPSDPQSPANAVKSSRPNTEAFQSLARIFARMRPEEAAEVLLLMSDEEVEGVVRNLGARQAASVLTNLPERRAAELARRLLMSDPGGGS